jgi:glycerophosphoryl diester phosphodiesterase
MTRFAAGFWLAATLIAAGPPPKVIAHRGGPAQMPENTIPAFQHAMRIGVDVLEFDMNVTADDQIVIHHDSVVNGAICKATGVQPGQIRLLRLDALRQFDCGSTAPPAHPKQKHVPGARMPTFEEFLKAVQGSKTLLLGETKMPPEGAASATPERFIELIYPLIRKYRVEDRFILQSADYRTIDELHKRDSRIATCLLSARRFKPDYLGLARKHKATHLMLRFDDIDKAGVQTLKAAGLQVYSGTSNKPSEWPQYVEMGMDGILTDDPVALIEYLKSRK